MNTQRLCPVYRKWLQLNPTDAREHRFSMQLESQQAHQQGKPNSALAKGYQAFETARIVLTALQPVSYEKNPSVEQDILAFGTMGMYLYALLNKMHKKREAHNILQECQQQLIAIWPLHATNPSVCRLISAVQYTLEQANIAPHQRSAHNHIHNQHHVLSTTAH